MACERRIGIQRAGGWEFAWARGAVAADSFAPNKANVSGAGGAKQSQFRAVGMRNKANLPLFGPENGGWAEQRSQSVRPGWARLRMADFGFRIGIRSRERYADWECVAPNEPNCPLFRAENGDLAEKQSQFSGPAGGGRRGVNCLVGRGERTYNRSR